MEPSPPDSSSGPQQVDPQPSGPDLSSVAVTAPRRGKPTFRLLAGVVVFVLATGGLVLWAMRETPDGVVREFLGALRERKLDEALKMAKVTSRPTGEEGRFITAEALGGNWTVTSVRTTSEGRGEARVEVAFAGPDGVGFVGQYPNYKTGEFELTEYSDGWRIDDPFVTVQFRHSPLRYIDLNGMKVPRETTLEPPESSSAKLQEYALLPGVYAFYPQVPDVVVVKPTVISVLPGSAGPLIVGAPQVAATAKGLHVAQQTVNAHIDECAKQARLAVEGCPFGAEIGHPVRQAGNEFRLVKVENVRWQVVRYPTVAVSGGDAFPFATISVVSPGTVELTGTAENSDDTRVTFNVRCQIERSGFVAGVTVTGSISVVPYETWTKQPPRTTHTCY